MMKSGSWSSYRAAMPPECFGELDGEPRRPCPPKCDGCGRFYSRKPGSGARTDVTPGSVFGPERVEFLCGSCAARTPLPPTEEQVREWDRRELEAYDKAQAEAWAQEAAAMQGRCNWCGRELPPGRTQAVCEPCERSVTADEPPCDGEDIPW